MRQSLASGDDGGAGGTAIGAAREGAAGKPISRLGEAMDLSLTTPRRPVSDRA